MADEDLRTVLMHNGDAILLPPDENGIVRHATTDGDQAFAQRIARRLLATQGESPWDDTIGIPVTGWGDVTSGSLVASMVARVVRGDSGVESIDGVELDNDGQANENGELSITVLATRKNGNAVIVPAVI